MSNRFAGRVAVVTGGSNGLGRAITQALTAEGANVGVLDILESTFFRDDAHVLAVTGDVASPDAVQEVFSRTVARWGHVDILVNDAGAYPNALVVDMAVEEFRRVLDVNVTGTFLCCQAFARHRLEQGGGGKIVSISSGSARSPRAAQSAYCASKAAIETFTRALALELGPHSINVNVVSPGYIDVRGWSEAFPDRASDEMRAALVRKIPLGVAGLPGDIANAVLFLCSEQAAHITGTVLDVDGGSIAGRFDLSGERRSG